MDLRLELRETCSKTYCKNEAHYGPDKYIPKTTSGTIRAVNKATAPTVLTITKGLVVFDLRRICLMALSTSALLAVRVIVVWFDLKA